MAPSAPLAHGWSRCCGRKPWRRHALELVGIWSHFYRSVQPLGTPTSTAYSQVLDAQPGLAYRELQRELGAANGTLRHHLDVLITNRSITVVPVNGRSCHYAGAPQQIEILREMNVGDSESAARMMPVGLSGAQRIVVARLMKTPLPKSQAELSRELGRSRATVHSAIKVLRRRGIVHSHELKLAPHLEGLQASGVQYEWLDERPLPE